MTKRNPKVLTGILIVLSVVSLALVAYLGFVLFHNNILPVKYRLTALGLLAIFALLLLGMGIMRGGRFQKFIGVLLCAGLLFLLDVFILYAQTGMRALESIQSPSAAPDTPKEDAHEAVDVDVKNGSFVVYISGIDTYGAISAESRSDVNIVAAINPKTRKILMVSMPRDAYLPIGGRGNWEKDKLTHAGIYGVGASVATLERALDTTINYYVRLNFTSFLEIIDVIGGVEVDNPEDFVAYNGTHFPVGHIELSGEDALAFVRERYNLSEGDFGRQKNQQRVIEGVFKKILGPELIFRFQGIMDTVAQSVETNMPTNKLWDFANAQLDHASDWAFQTVGVPGEGVIGLHSYAIPEATDLWFYQVDEDGLREVQTLFQKVLDGENISVEDPLQEGR